MTAKTDRELLELAAKAAGLSHMKYLGGAGLGRMIDPTRPGETGTTGLAWNPLTDDGDALRLAVKLGMSIEIEHYEEATYAYAGESPREYAIENWKGDRHSATRRAIVRAAAVIGETL